MIDFDKLKDEELSYPGIREVRVLRTTKKSVVYQRGESLLYYSKELFNKTVKKFNHQQISSRDLKAFDVKYKNKPCHCMFFMLLIHRFYETPISTSKKPYSLKLDV